MIGVCVLALFVVSARPARADAGEDALKLTHSSVVAAITQGNVAMLQGLVHQSALGFFYGSQQVSEVKQGFSVTDAVAPILADLSRFTSTTTGTTYRVVGDTGVVCMTSVRVPTKEEKKKDSKLQTAYYRLSYTYVRVGAEWKLLCWHTSQTPLVVKS
jgi:hypothetical protein